ncbi:MAG TPA: hypothetical protein VGX92_18645 [Pyrinomonadaceae bacterium]|jgi:hypothetical protein|nr:hypothetical protein [Pyrinomonadaceae bacterium]
MLNIVAAILGLLALLVLFAIVYTYPSWSSGASVVFPGLGLIVSSRLLLILLVVIELGLIGALVLLLK